MTSLSKIIIEIVGFKLVIKIGLTEITPQCSNSNMRGSIANYGSFKVLVSN